MKKFLLYFLVLQLFVNSTKGQQIFKISQFTQHNFLYNPAAAGANDNASIGVMYRKMWSGIEGGPKTFFLFGDTYLEKKKLGIAAALYNDVTGPTSRTGGQLDLSYHLTLNEKSKLLFGIGAQFMQFKVDFSAISKYLVNDPILASSGNKFLGDANAGVYYKSPTLNIGISAAQLIQSKFNFIKGTQEEGKLYRHYFLVGHYNWKVDEANVLVPNLMLKYEPNTPTDFEIGLRDEFKDMFWFGFNFHLKQSFTGYAGFKAYQGKLAIGYAYDEYKTPVNIFDGGGSAHEISIRYFFKK